MKTLRSTCFLLAALAVLIPGWAADTVPTRINYQGLLVNPDNTPLPNGNYQVHFRVYDQPTGGNLIWGPQTLSAAVYNGQFNVLLGPVDVEGDPIVTAFLAPDRYLEVQVGSNPAIAPRQQILSAPFALNAGRLNSKGWDAVFNNGDPDTGFIPGAKINAGSVTSAQILDGTIQQADLGPIYQLAASDGNPANALVIDASGNANFIAAVTAAGNIAGANIGSRVLALTATQFQTPFSYATVSLRSYRLPTGTESYVYLKGMGTTLRLECYNLEVTNLVTGTGTALVWDSSSMEIRRNTSSRRYKDQIEPWQDDFSKILSLEPKQYVRKEHPEVREVGYIAEELDQAGLSAATVYDAQGRPEAIDYGRLMIYANGVLKDHQEKIRKQEAELQSLRAELEALRQLVRQSQSQ